MDSQSNIVASESSSSKMHKKEPSRPSMTAVVDSIVAIHRMASSTNHTDDSWYTNFFCSEISVSQLSTFHSLFLEKTGHDSNVINKDVFQQCVVPILTEEQSLGFRGKRFQVLFDKIDANRDGLVSWDDISLFILQGSGAHRRSLTSIDSCSFFAINEKTTKQQHASRRQYHKDVISSMHVIAHLDVLVTAGHDGHIGVWKLKDLDMLQMIQVCPSNSTWILGMTDVSWSFDASRDTTMICIVTSSMRLYYAKVDEISSAFSSPVPETSCPCVYAFPGNQSATCIKGFRLLHAEGDTLPSSGQSKFDDILAVGFENGDINIMLSRVDRMKPSELFKIPTHSSTISALIWIAEMNTLVAASHDSKISLHMFNLSRDGISETKIFSAHRKAVNAIVFSVRDAVVASCGLERDILVWSPFTTQVLARLTGHNSSVFSLVVDPQSSTLISLDSSRHVYVWSLTTYQFICKRDLASKLHADVDIKSIIVEGSTLFLGTSAPLAWPISQSLSLEASQSSRTTSHTSPVIALLQSYRFEQFITVHADGQAITWAMANGSEITNFWVCPSSSVVVNCAVLDPKQRRLFVGADDGIIRIYNIFNGQLLHELIRSSSSNASGTTSESSEVCSMCFVYRQMRMLLAATFSDTSTISFWPEYPPNYLMSAVFKLDLRGNIALSTPEQIAFLLHDHASSSLHCVIMLMANGRLASISVDSGHTIAEFSAINPASIKRGDLSTISLDETKSHQPFIRMFVLAHTKNCLIAMESENRFLCWDFSRNLFTKSFDVPSRVLSNSSSIMCMDLSPDDGLFCVGDSHGWIHTYLNPFSVPAKSKSPNWSFCANADSSIVVLKFVGNLDIIATSGSDLLTKLWRPDGKHFLHDYRSSEKNESNAAASSIALSFPSSSLAVMSTNYLGALACTPWKYESLLLAQGKFSRDPQSKFKETVRLLRRMETEIIVPVALDEEETKPKPQRFLKSLKLLPPLTPQEERDQSRMLLALATPRRAPAAVPASAHHLHSFRGPHSKITIQPIAPDPYFSPNKKGVTAINSSFKRIDHSRAFLPKDSFKESILRREEQSPFRASEASPLLRRSLKLVGLEYH
jgi:WD40 repeat protein